MNKEFKTYLIQGRRFQAQFTGLLDSNNLKIFEYDIIQTYYDDGAIRATSYVHWIQKDCRFNISRDLVASRHLKVVGTIFYTPWLIKQEYLFKIEQELGIELVKRVIQEDLREEIIS